MNEEVALGVLEVLYALEENDSCRAALLVAMNVLKKHTEEEKRAKKLHKALIDAGIILVKKKGENENVKSD